MERNYEIIAVDFDGTLCFSKWPECGEPNQALINYLKKWKSDGTSSSSGHAVSGNHLQKPLNGVETRSLSSILSMTSFQRQFHSFVNSKIKCEIC